MTTAATLSGPTSTVASAVASALRLTPKGRLNYDRHWLEDKTTLEELIETVASEIEATKLSTLAEVITEAASIHDVTLGPNVTVKLLQNEEDTPEEVVNKKLPPQTEFNPSSRPPPASRPSAMTIGPLDAVARKQLLRIEEDRKLKVQLRTMDRRIKVKEALDEYRARLREHLEKQLSLIRHQGEQLLRMQQEEERRQSELQHELLDQKKLREEATKIRMMETSKKVREAEAQKQKDQQRQQQEQEQQQQSQNEKDEINKLKGELNKATQRVSEAFNELTGVRRAFEGTVQEALNQSQGLLLNQASKNDNLQHHICILRRLIELLEIRRTEEVEEKRRQEQQQKKQGQQQQQRQQEQQQKQQQEQIQETQVLNQGAKEISQENLRIYTDLMRFRDEWKKTNVIEDKQFNFSCKKVISTTVNAISPVSKSHLKDKLEKLRTLLSGQNVEIGESLSFNAGVHPRGIGFAMDVLARKFVYQGEDVISSHPKTGFSIAYVMNSLGVDFPDFTKLLLSYFYTVCPYLVPYYIKRRPDESDRDFYSRRGYEYDSGGTVEKQNLFCKRMSGVARLYAIWTIADLPLDQGGKPVSHGLGNAFRLLASTLNLHPINDVTASILYEVLEITGHSLMANYKSVFLKLLKCLKNEYLKKIEEVTLDGCGGPVTRLEMLVNKILKESKISPPEALLPPGFI